jgi:hypothetical protein
MDALVQLNGLPTVAFDVVLSYPIPTGWSYRSDRRAET